MGDSVALLGAHQAAGAVALQGADGPTAGPTAMVEKMREMLAAAAGDPVPAERPEATGGGAAKRPATMVAAAAMGAPMKRPAAAGPARVQYAKPAAAGPSRVQHKKPATTGPARATPAKPAAAGPRARARNLRSLRRLAPRTRNVLPLRRGSRLDGARRFPSAKRVHPRESRIRIIIAHAVTGTGASAKRLRCVAAFAIDMLGRRGGWPREVAARGGG